jgi:hypothetical protein
MKPARRVTVSSGSGSGTCVYLPKCGSSGGGRWNNFLPTKAELNRRHVEQESFCPACGAEAETLIYGLCVPTGETILAVSGAADAVQGARRACVHDGPAFLLQTGPSPCIPLLYPLGITSN